MSKHHWLEISEYILLASSVVGTVAAGATKQVLFAATPLTLAMGLNLMQQKRINQSHQTRLETLQALIHQQESVNPDFDSLIEPLAQSQQRLEKEHQEFQESILSSGNFIQVLTEQHHQLCQLTQGIYEQAQGQLNSLQQQVSQLSQAIEATDERLKVLEGTKKNSNQNDEIANIDEEDWGILLDVDYIPTDTTSIKENLSYLTQKLKNFGEDGAINLQGFRQEMEDFFNSLKSREKDA